LRIQTAFPFHCNDFISLQHHYLTNININGRLLWDIEKQL
jgi:hypothetical protein